MTNAGIFAIIRWILRISGKNHFSAHKRTDTRPRQDLKAAAGQKNRKEDEKAVIGQEDCDRT